MEKLTIIVQTALPVFLALAFGVLCRSKQILTRDGIDALKKVVLNLTLPFVLLNAFATAEYTPTALILPLVMFFVCCLALLIGFLAVKVLKVKGRLVPFFASGFEAGMLGYALFALLFPDVKISSFALPDIGQTLFVFTLYKVLLSGKKDIRSIWHDMATTPILWAVAAGVLIGATGLYSKLQLWGIGGIFDSATSFMSAPTGAIILLTVGYDLVLKDIHWKKTVSLVIIRLCSMAICHAVMIFLNRTVLNGILFEGAAILMCILPPPYVIPVFADEPDERVQVSSALSALTLITIVMFGVLAVFIKL